MSIHQRPAGGIGAHYSQFILYGRAVTLTGAVSRFCLTDNPFYDSVPKEGTNIALPMWERPSLSVADR